MTTRFDCGGCGVHYSVDDDKARGKILKIRCKYCKHITEVIGPPKVTPKEDKLPFWYWYLIGFLTELIVFLIWSFI